MNISKSEDRHDLREVAVLDTVQHIIALPNTGYPHVDGYEILPERRIVVVVNMDAFLIAYPDRISLPGRKYYDCIRLRFVKGPADEELQVDIGEAERLLGTIPRRERK